MKNKQVQWQFIAHHDGVRESWSWRRLVIDGAVEATSERHTDFGKAVLDAVTNGFKPRTQGYVVISREWVTHYQPQGTSDSSLPGEEVVAPLSIRLKSPGQQGGMRRKLRATVELPAKPGPRDIPAASSGDDPAPSKKRV
jgi:hypothetical protein